MIKKHFFSAVALIILLAVICGWASDAEDTFDMSAAEWLLYPVQDESSIETTVAKYIRQKMDLNADIRFLDDDMKDMAVHYTIQPDNTPPLKVRIDTAVTRRDAGVIAERAVMIKTWYILPDDVKTAVNLAKILELNNKHMQGYWIPDRIYLDKDNDIAMETFLNIPSKDSPIHCEVVLDSLVSFSTAWGVYYKQLSETVDLPAGSGD